MAPGARSKLGVPMFEPKYSRFDFASFRSKSTVLKKVLVTFLGLFGFPRSDSATPAVICHLGNCVPLPSSLRSYFHVTGISPKNPKKAARLKPTDFPVNFMLCLLFGPADSAI